MIRLQQCNVNTPEYWDNEFETEILINKKRVEYTRFERAVDRIKDGSSVIDLGCGKGEFLQYLHLKRPACEIYGIDFSKVAIEYAKKLLPKGTFSEFDVQNVSYYASLHNKFDFVVSFETIEHLESPLMFVNEIECIIKDGGFLILSTPYNDMVKGGLEHVYSFDFQAMMTLFHTPRWTIITLNRYGKNYGNMLLIATINKTK